MIFNFLGCGYDDEFIWSGTPCGFGGNEEDEEEESVAIEPGFYFVAGGENSFGLGSECRNMESSSDLFGRCCADWDLDIPPCCPPDGMSHFTYICTRAHVHHTHYTYHMPHAPHTHTTHTHTHTHTTYTTYATYTTYTPSLDMDELFFHLCDANTLCNKTIYLISINLVSLRLSVTYDMFGICLYNFAEYVCTLNICLVIQTYFRICTGFTFVFV